MKRTLKDNAAEFQAQQDKLTLKTVAQCKTKAEAATKLGITRQALRMRLMRIAANAGVTGAELAKRPR